MSELKFDLSEKGLRCILKPYQIEIMRHFWETHPLTMGSRAVHTHLQSVGGDVAMSRATVINFLNSLVDEEVLLYDEETGKGGYHRIYGLWQWARTELRFRNMIWMKFTSRLKVFKKGEAEG